MSEPVMAIHQWNTNAELILDAVRLGYLHTSWSTLDPTYGEGTFWKKWRPDVLTGCDLVETKSPIGFSVDFCKLPFGDGAFQAVVFDPPYKLNGTPDPEIDERYGVHEVTDWRDRIDLITQGLSECIRVLGDGYLLVKVRDQVVSGKVRWQTDIVTEHARARGLGKVDRFDMLSYRPQPLGRRQVHARRNASTLLVFQRGWSS